MDYSNAQIWLKRTLCMRYNGLQDSDKCGPNLASWLIVKGVSSEWKVIIELLFVLILIVSVNFIKLFFFIFFEVAIKK